MWTWENGLTTFENVVDVFVCLMVYIPLDNIWTYGDVTFAQRFLPLSRKGLL